MIIKKITPLREYSDFLPEHITHFLLDIKECVKDESGAWAHDILKSLMDMRFPSRNVTICLNADGITEPPSFKKMGSVVSVKISDDFPCAKNTGFVLGAPIFFKISSPTQ